MPFLLGIAKKTNSNGEARAMVPPLFSVVRKEGLLGGLKATRSQHAHFGFLDHEGSNFIDLVVTERDCILKYG